MPYTIVKNETKQQQNTLGFWKYFAKYFPSFFFHYLWTEELNCASVAKQIMQNYTAWLFYIPEPWSKDFSVASCLYQPVSYPDEFHNEYVPHLTILLFFSLHLSVIINKNASRALLYERKWKLLQSAFFLLLHKARKLFPL